MKSNQESLPGRRRRARCRTVPPRCIPLCPARPSTLDSRRPHRPARTLPSTRPARPRPPLRADLPPAALASPHLPAQRRQSQLSSPACLLPLGLTEVLARLTPVQGDPASRWRGAGRRRRAEDRGGAGQTTSLPVWGLKVEGPQLCGGRPRLSVGGVALWGEMGTCVQCAVGTMVRLLVLSLLLPLFLTPPVLPSLLLPPTSTHSLRLCLSLLVCSIACEYGSYCLRECLFLYEELPEMLLGSPLAAV